MIQGLTKEKRSFSNGHVRIERLLSVKQGRHYLSSQLFYRTNINKTTYRFPLGSNQKNAFKLAQEIKATIKAGHLSLEILQQRYLHRAKKLKQNSVITTTEARNELTIEDILVAHTKSEKVLAIQSRTALGYRRSLLRVVYCAHLQMEGKYAPLGRLSDAQIRIAEQQPLTVLTRQFARAYLESTIEEIEDLDQLESAKRTANSTLRQAKSIFSKEAIELYEDELQLNLPNLSGFQSKKPFKTETIKYRLPDKETIERLFTFYRSQPVLSDTWTALTLALYGGLRRSEIIASRASWLSDSQGPQISVRTESDFKPKGKVSRNIPLLSDIYSLLEKRQSEESITTYLLNGDLGDREKLIDDLNIELRGIFGDIQKPFHELRKLYGCWIASSIDIREAQKRLGHVSVETTEKYYADINMSPDVANAWNHSH